MKELTAEEIEKALREGREIVVVSVYRNCDSAIWWAKGSSVYTFAKEIGVFKRKDSIEEAAKVLAGLQTDCNLLVRGNKD